MDTMESELESLVTAEETWGGGGTARHAQELGMRSIGTGSRHYRTGQALTHATRHVREETRVLPLDPAYCLVVFRIRYRGPFCFPLHGLQD